MPCQTRDTAQIHHHHEEHQAHRDLDSVVIQPGKAEVTCATPAEMETATVRM